MPSIRFDSAKKAWQRLGERQPSPQNLYEQTSLALDTKRDQLLLHGGGDETGRALDLRPEDPALDESPAQGGGPRRRRPAGLPARGRLPAEPGCVPELRPGARKGHRSVGLSARRQRLVSHRHRATGGRRSARGGRPEPRRGLRSRPRPGAVVVGTGGDRGTTKIYALRYQNTQAKFVGPGDP